MQENMFDAVYVTAEPGSQVTITGEISWDLAEEQRSRAVSHLGKGMNIDGFRKGNIPEKILVARIGEMVLLEEMALRAVLSVYPDILHKKGVDAIGTPNLSLTKLARGNPVGFSIRQTVVPTFKLPDYKTIAKNINEQKQDSVVTEEDVQKQIDDLLHRKAAWEKMRTLQVLESEGKIDEAKELADADPVSVELTDDVVKTLGSHGQFSHVEDFRAKIREHLEIEKKNELQSKQRSRITDEIVDKTDIEIPELLIEHEIRQMFAQMEEELMRAQIVLDDYLSHIKKTKEDLRSEWLPAAHKRAKLQLIFGAIAKEEKITPDKEEVEREVGKLKERFKDVDDDRIRAYVSSVLVNDMVTRLLQEC